MSDALTHSAMYFSNRYPWYSSLATAVTVTNLGFSILEATYPSIKTGGQAHSSLLPSRESGIGVEDWYERTRRGFGLSTASLAEEMGQGSRGDILVIARAIDNARYPATTRVHLLGSRINLAHSV